MSATGSPSKVDSAAAAIETWKVGAAAAYICSLAGSTTPCPCLPPPEILASFSARSRSAPCPLIEPVGDGRLLPEWIKVEDYVVSTEVFHGGRRRTTGPWEVYGSSQ